MLRDDVFRFFGGGQKTADALDVTKSAAFQWGEIVPERVAYLAQERSFGHLKVDPSVYDAIRKAQKERRQKQVNGGGSERRAAPG